MSAAETERVEVDVSPSEYVEADATDAEAPTSSASSASTSRRNFMSMLTATTPSERPAEQDGTFSTEAAWYQHLELAVKKATGSDGTPAWLNLTMSAFLLVAESANLVPDEQDEQDETAGPDSSVTRDPNSSGDPSSVEPTDALDSGKVGTHENGETSVIGG